jgi:hypothetical protein
MDLHVYRTSQDRWHALKDAAREGGAVLAVNAFTFGELVERLTPEAVTATPGQRLAVLDNRDPESSAVGAVYDAIAELKAARVRPHELRDAGAEFLADMLERYDRGLRLAGVFDPQDRCALAAARVREGGIGWLDRFQRVVLHAIYDLSEAQFMLVKALIEAAPDGGAVVLFNTTANVKPTQFAEWTWQRFVQDESLAEKTFPEFCRPSHKSREILERLFDFEPHDPLPSEHWLRIVEAPGRYKEIERIGADIADLLESGEHPNDVAVVVRHIDTYGEMIEDVFARYAIPHHFETAVPLARIPLIKYWLALLDLVESDRPRDAMARVMSSAYFNPRLSPAIDVEQTLAGFGYIDRRHLRASDLATRKNSPLASEIRRFEDLLEELESATDSVTGFMARVPGPTESTPLTERDRQAWRVLVEEIASVGAVGEAQARQRAASSYDRALSFQMGEKRAVIDRAYRSDPSDFEPAQLSFTEFRRLVSEVAGLRTVDRPASTHTPPGAARVSIIHPHSLGARERRWIFAPGFSDGEFPSHSTPNPLLLDATIDAVNKRIRPRRLMTARDRSRREPLFLFLILDAAVHRVTLTYPASGLEGDPIYPSIYIGEIVRHYAASPVETAQRSLPRAEGEWRARVAEEWRAGSMNEDRALTLLGAGIVERAKVERKGIRRARLGKDVLPLDGVWHPSELNALDSCPFVFLARYRLNIRPSDSPDFEVSALEIGVLAHAILREFHAVPVPTSAVEARSRMDQIIARRLSAADVSGQGPYSVFDPALWKIRRRQLVSALARYVDFAVVDARAGFETQTPYLDAPLPAAQLGATVLAGKPDHVSIRRDGPRIEAIRIDDFKYSAASSATSKLLKDSLQIPIYAHLARQALGAESSVRIEGRYLLLRSPGNPVLSQAIDGPVFDDVQNRVDALLAKVREGALEPDPSDKQGCIECEYRRLCRFYGV